MDQIISITITIIIILFGIRLFTDKPPEYHSHWNVLLEEVKYSTKEFYKRLEAELQSHGIENLTIYSRHFRESGLTSKKRLYLRVMWKGYIYDCCCAPFGDGTFVSWWLMKDQSGTEMLLAKIPYVGDLLVQCFFPNTYYKVDTASMFMTYAQSSVIKVIDDITKEKGVRSLTEDERKPILKDVFKR